MRNTFLMLLSLLAGLGGTLSGAEPKPAAPKERFRLADLLPRTLQKNPRLNLSIITELSDDGRKVAAPTKERPAYYTVLDGGLVEAGDVMAGEKPPAAEKLARMMRSALAESGFQPATAANPPTLLVHYRWGVYNHLSPLSDEDGDPEDDAMRKNFMARASLVGGQKFAGDLLRAYDRRGMGALEAFRLKEPDYELLVQMAESDLYFLIAIAYDGEAAKQGKKKVLWTTKLSTDAHGLVMDETLPALVANAGPYFGHETKGAVIFHPRIHEGRVEIGEATVKGYLDEVPAAGAGAKPAKKP
jgi:hypothetical protein